MRHSVHFTGRIFRLNPSKAACILPLIHQLKTASISAMHTTRMTTIENGFCYSRKDINFTEQAVYLNRQGNNGTLN